MAFPFRVSIVAAALTLVAAAPASATLQLALDINGATFFCADNTACDTNPAVGTLQIANQTFGGVSFLGSAQTQTTGAFNSLNTTSFQITNNNGTSVTYQLAVGGTGFQGPVTTLSESGSGTFQNASGSTTDLTFFADATNTQGANTSTDFPGVPQANSGTITASGLNDSFNFNHLSSFTAAGLYGMTLGTSGTLTAGGQLVGRSQSIVGLEQVPEPASLALLGTGLAGLGLFWRRRRTSNINAAAAV